LALWCDRHVAGKLQFVLLLYFLVALPQAVFGQTKTILWRTPINDAGICSLSGGHLTLPEVSHTPLRAWAGILTDPTGGPAAADCEQRHFQQVAERFSAWKLELRGEEAAAEINSRIRHAGPFHPVYFDVVVVQGAGRRELQWLIDTNLDGVLEPRGAASTHSEDSTVGAPDAWLRMSLVTNGQTARVDNAGPPMVPEPAKVNESNNPESVPEASGVQELSSLLLKLDRPAVRKQHLPQIVAVATELIQQLEKEHGADSIELADPLYRKGRALGYHELPDVVAKNPISNPAQLNRDFEDTFERLQSLVDVTTPKYVLLAIRRERRRGNRGAALDLLDLYRRNHPHPDWYLKKRSDLLRELNLPLAAHQAAANLWLHGARPARPIPVIFQMASEAPAVTLSVDWTAALPWRSDKFFLRRVWTSVLEGVAWLPVNSTHHVGRTADHYHEFRTDAAMIESGSVVPLRLVSELEK
jgi:hypothetical protein